MSLLIKALIALVIGVVVAFIVGQVCKHFGVDIFWGWVAGVIAGLLYFVSGPVPPQRPVLR
jgi:steroid 5-alpha reductase family enzyme